MGAHPFGPIIFSLNFPSELLAQITSQHGGAGTTSSDYPLTFTVWMHLQLEITHSVWLFAPWRHASRQMTSSCSFVLIDQKLEAMWHGWMFKSVMFLELEFFSHTVLQLSRLQLIFQFLGLILVWLYGLRTRLCMTVKNWTSNVPPNHEVPLSAKLAHYHASYRLQ